MSKKTPVSSQVHMEVDRELQRRNAARNNRLKKFVDHRISSAYAVAGTISQVSNIPQGIAVGNRVGDKAYIQKLSLFAYHVPAANTSSAIRFILFRWLENTVPAVSDVLDPGGSGTIEPSSHLSFVNRDIIKVLHDDFITLYATGSPSVLTVRRENINVSSLVTFNTAAVTGVGNVYVLFIGTNVTVSCDSAIRVFFHDDE